MIQASEFHDCAGCCRVFVRKAPRRSNTAGGNHPAKKSHPATYRMAMGEGIYLNAGSSSKVMK